MRNCYLISPFFLVLKELLQKNNLTCALKKKEGGGGKGEGGGEGGESSNSSLNVSMLSFSMPRYWAGSKILLFLFLT